MRTSTEIRLKQLTATLFVVVSAVGIGFFVKSVLSKDPLAKQREKSADDLPTTVGILMKDTEFKRFENGQPSASCMVEEMTIADNRMLREMSGISNGRIKWKNTTYQFDAKLGNWNGYSKILSLHGNIQVKGPNFNLKSYQMGYDEPRKLLTVPQQVEGIAYGGNLSVASFEFNIDEQTFVAGKGKWTGKLPKELIAQSPEPVTSSRTWDFEFDGIKKSKDNKDVVIYTNATATDGEVIIKAPTMSHNEKTDVLTATKNVQYFSPKSNVLADKIVVYRKEKRAVLTGNVSMYIKPKSKENEKATVEPLTPLPVVVPESIASKRPPAPENDEAAKKKEEDVRSAKNLREYPLTITANEIEYWYKKGERRAKIQGKPQAKQEISSDEWRYVWSYTAFYDGEKELLTLESAKGKQSVILKNSLGDELFGEWGQISTKEGEDDYEFRKGKAKMTTRDDDLPAQEKKKDGSGLSGPIRRA
jgi:hypothetical protein